MKCRLLLLVVLLVSLVGSLSYAAEEEFVEKMQIKAVQEESESHTGNTQADISSSKVLVKYVPLGQATVLTFPQSFMRASVANPHVAEQLVLSPTQLYLTGKSLGYTTLTVWGEEKQILFVLELVVHFPIESLRQNLSTLFPNEKDVVIATAHDHIVLTGHLATLDIKSKIGQVAGAYAPQKVLNFLKFIHE